jgi:uncharacterized protein YaaR (DUF327 family)
MAFGRKKFKNLTQQEEETQPVSQVQQEPPSLLQPSSSNKDREVLAQLVEKINQTGDYLKELAIWAENQVK